jgi:hypothetical protein
VRARGEEEEEGKILSPQDLYDTRTCTRQYT